jgi:hypothetical protein
VYFPVKRYFDISIPPSLSGWYTARSKPQN